MDNTVKMHRIGRFFFFVIVVSLHFQHILAIQLKNFVLEPCKRSNNVLHVENISLNSNGTKWIFTGGFTVNSTVEAPIQVLIKMERRIFFRWVKIPCISDFGSCSYSDLCSLLEGYETCQEDPNKEQTIPCKCPIFKGNYTINIESDHEVISHFGGVLKGNYRASLKMSKNDESVACYNLKFKITT